MSKSIQYQAKEEPDEFIKNVKHTMISLLEENGFFNNPERPILRDRTAFEKLQEFIYGIRLMSILIDNSNKHLSVRFISSNKDKTADLHKEIYLPNLNKEWKTQMITNLINDSIGDYIRFMNNTAIFSEFEKINYGRIKTIQNTCEIISLSSTLIIYSITGNRKTMNSSIESFDLKNIETQSNLYNFCIKNNLIVPELLKKQIL